MVTKRIFLGNTEESLLLCGEQDANLKAIEQKHGVQIFARSSNLAVRGNARKVDQAIATLEELREKVHSIRHEKHGKPAPYSLTDDMTPGMKLNTFDEIITSATGKSIRPMTENQKKYVETIYRSDMVMGVGPAGTGKTFLAVACALREWQAAKVSRIVLTRPVVEAGEKLGFLPGDLHDKINPYLKPLYDAFQTLLGTERFRICKDDETIEIAPLAYMRGRTLDNAFVILDEAQNTTPEQMKMFLTRMGSRSKMVITGDVTQIDLEFQRKSGFVEAMRILKSVPEVQVVRFAGEDVMRHPLVKKIIHAYDTSEKKSDSKE